MLYISAKNNIISYSYLRVLITIYRLFIGNISPGNRMDLLLRVAVEDVFVCLLLLHICLVGCVHIYEAHSMCMQF